MGVSEKKIHEIVNQDLPEKENFPEERNIDFEIEEIEKEINRLSSRLESLRLEKAKRNAKIMEKRGRTVAAKFMDPPKQSTRSSNEQSKIEESMSLSAKLKTPKRGLSMGPTEIMRGVRRGISLGPAEIYSVTKLKQLGKQDITSPVAAKFMDPSKQSTRSSNEQSKIEESMSLSAKLKTPKRGLISMGPTEIMRGVRRGISLGPEEIYSATKLKQLCKQDITTPVQQSANRRKSCYWKLHDIDELRVTKERGKSLSLSPKLRSKTVSKAQVPKQAATTVGSKKTSKKEDAVISSIQPKKLFTKDGDKSAPAKKPLKSGRVVASRYNQVSNGGNSAVKEFRKRSLPENEEDFKRSDKKRVSLTGKSQGGEQLATESREKKRWDIPSEVMIPTNVGHKTPLSVSKMLDLVPKMKNLRCITESPRDSGPAKRVSKLIGRKSFFSMEDGVDGEVEESVCQSLNFAEEQVMEEYPKIRILRNIDESPRDSGAAKRVSQLVGKKSFFNDEEDEMPVFSFEEEDGEEH